MKIKTQETLRRFNVQHIDTSDGKIYFIHENDIDDIIYESINGKKMERIKIKREWIIEIIDIFENFLDEKNVKIENEEKEDIEDPAIIAGSDCDRLELDLIDLFELMGISVSEMIQGDGDETVGIDK